MLIIIAHHFSVHGGFSFSANKITVNRLWIQFIQIGGKIGVDVFVLISGYFLVSARGIKTSRLLKLWLQIFTYSVVIFAVFVATGEQQFGIKELIKHLFPITFPRWWFASTYFVLYLISPYLNRLLQALDKKTYQCLLVLLTVCWCLIPTFLSSWYQSNELLWFACLYALAGYVRLHAAHTEITGQKYLLCAGATTLLTFLSAVVFDIMGLRMPYFAEHATYFYDMQRLPILLISLFLLLGFMKINIGYCKVINIIASATFGIYLIHDNNYVRPFLWHTVFKNATFSDSTLLIPYSIAVIFAVFIGAMAIDLFRIYALERNYMPMIQKLSFYIDKQKEHFFASKIFDKI